MKILTPGVSLQRFFLRVAGARRRLLLLDYDGTLAPFRPEREKAYPYPGVCERLTRLQADRKTRLIIVSGRAVEDLLPLLGMTSYPEIWGSHGAERYLPGQGIRPPDLPTTTRENLGQIETWIAEHDLGGFTEKKPAGFAFHYRGLNRTDCERVKKAVMAAWEMKVEELGLELHEFDGGIELRAAGIGKGDAVGRVLAENPDAAAAYLGDDRTDEDAFRALAGRGLRVLVRPEFRETEADLHLTPPHELLDFLDRWLEIVSAAK